MERLKKCRLCKIEKHWGNFGLLKKNGNKLKNECKDCLTEYQRQRRSNETKAKELKEYQTNYYKKNKEIISIKQKERRPITQEEMMYKHIELLSDAYETILKIEEKYQRLILRVEELRRNDD